MPRARRDQGAGQASPPARASWCCAGWSFLIPVGSRAICRHLDRGRILTGGNNKPAERCYFTEGDADGSYIRKGLSLSILATTYPPSQATTPHTLHSVWPHSRQVISFAHTTVQAARCAAMQCSHLYTVCVLILVLCSMFAEAVALDRAFRSLQLVAGPLLQRGVISSAIARFRGVLPIAAFWRSIRSRILG